MSNGSQTILNKTSLSQDEQPGLKMMRFSAGGGSRLNGRSNGSQQNSQQNDQR